MVTTVSKNTPYTNRISVNVTHGEVVLTIRKVQVKDDVEFICSVKPVTDQIDGSADGGTKLRVFGELHCRLIADTTALRLTITLHLQIHLLFPFHNIVNNRTDVTG